MHARTHTTHTHVHNTHTLHTGTQICTQHTHTCTQHTHTHTHTHTHVHNTHTRTKKAKPLHGSHVKHSYCHPANEHWDVRAPLRHLSLVQANPPGGRDSNPQESHGARLRNLKFHNDLNIMRQGQLGICFPSKHHTDTH